MQAKMTMPLEESLADVTYFSFKGRCHALEAAIPWHWPCFIYFFPFSVQISLYPPVVLLAGCGLVVPPVLITECPPRPLFPRSEGTFNIYQRNAVLKNNFSIRIE